MVNEQRPYLPIALLSLTWLIPAGLAFSNQLQNKFISQVVVVSACLVFICALAALTFDRNLTYQSKVSYYRDVIQKGGCGGLSFNNYGLTFMAKGQYDEALKYFQQAEEKSPNWHIIHTNLAITYERLDKPELSLSYHKQAVAAEHYSNHSLIYRGKYYLTKNDYQNALTDFENSLEQAVDYYPSYKGLATAHSGMGNWEQSWMYTQQNLNRTRIRQSLIFIK